MQFQDSATTKKLIERIEEADADGVTIRYLANAGAGEPTMHPEFCEVMGSYGDFLRKRAAEHLPPMEISVVTNGAKLTENGILDAIAGNEVSLIVSLPTLDPEKYGTLMVRDATRGRELLEVVLDGLNRAFRLQGNGVLKKLFIHVSPPVASTIRSGFDTLVTTLTSMAHTGGASELSLVMFPTRSNRSGLAGRIRGGTDLYPDLFRRYNGKQVNGVQIHMTTTLRRFFHSPLELVDFFLHFRYPCLWNANLFIAADGRSVCCNDQACRISMGSVMSHSVRELVTVREQFTPSVVCTHCNQAPEGMGGSIL
jgi:hypothetical protein